jgi:hypothetical protein
VGRAWSDMYEGRLEAGLGGRTCARPWLTGPTRACARGVAGEMRYAPDEAWTGYGQEGWT